MFVINIRKLHQIFYNNQMYQQHEDKNQNKDKPHDYVFRTEELPQTDFPDEDNLIKFFKVKNKITQSYFNIQIGLLVINYQQFQEDFVTYLVNLLMCQAQFLNVFIVDPMHLYVSMNAAAEIGSTNNYDYLQLQSDVYYLLDFCQNIILKFFENQLSQKAIFQDEKNSEDIIKSFQLLCIKPIIKKHEEIFNRGNKL